jgi:hypothetical protein
MALRVPPHSRDSQEGRLVDSPRHSKPVLRLSIAFPRPCASFSGRTMTGSARFDRLSPEISPTTPQSRGIMSHSMNDGPMEYDQILYWRSPRGPFHATMARSPSSCPPHREEHGSPIDIRTCLRPRKRSLGQVPNSGSPGRRPARPWMIGLPHIPSVMDGALPVWLRRIPAQPSIPSRARGSPRWGT